MPKERISQSSNPSDNVAGPPETMPDAKTALGLRLSPLETALEVAQLTARYGEFSRLVGRMVRGALSEWALAPDNDYHLRLWGTLDQRMRRELADAVHERSVSTMRAAGLAFPLALAAGCTTIRERDPEDPIVVKGEKHYAEITVLRIRKKERGRIPDLALAALAGLAHLERAWEDPNSLTNPQTGRPVAISGRGIVMREAQEYGILPRLIEEGNFSESARSFAHGCLDITAGEGELTRLAVALLEDNGRALPHEQFRPEPGMTKDDSFNPQERLVNGAPELDGSFEDAFRALRAVSLRLQRVHQNVALPSGAYRCPLTSDRTFQEKFSATLREIDELDSEITRGEESIDRQVFDDPGLRESAKREMEALSKRLTPGPEFGFKRLPTWETLSKMKGVLELRNRREERVDTLYDRHADTLEAIGRYLPSGTERPITRREAHDRGILPGEDYMIRESVQTAKLSKRVEGLASAIRAAEDRRSKMGQASEGSPPPLGKLLKGAKEICAALKLDSAKWRWLVKLSRETNGPLHCGVRGKPLAVMENRLRVWFTPSVDEWNQRNPPRQSQPTPNLGKERKIGTSAKPGLDLPDETGRPAFSVKTRRSDRGKNRKPRHS